MSVQSQPQQQQPQTEQEPLTKCTKEDCIVFHWEKEVGLVDKNTTCEQRRREVEAQLQAHQQGHQQAHSPTQPSGDTNMATLSARSTGSGTSSSASIDNNVGYDDSVQIAVNLQNQRIKEDDEDQEQDADERMDQSDEDNMNGLGFSTRLPATKPYHGRRKLVAVEEANKIAERARQEHKVQLKTKIKKGDRENDVPGENKKSNINKYDRRLHLNRQSASAARVRREVYIHALEVALNKMEAEKYDIQDKLDKAEQEKKTMAREIEQLRADIAEREREKTHLAQPHIDQAQIQPYIPPQQQPVHDQYMYIQPQTSAHHHHHQDDHDSAVDFFSTFNKEEYQAQLDMFLDANPDLLREAFFAIQEEDQTQVRPAA